MRSELDQSPTSTVSIRVDGVAGRVAAGSSILSAAAELGVQIPSLCYHPDLTPAGSCRLCLVDIAGRAGPQAACVETVAEGMRVTTQTDDLRRTRREMLRLLLDDYSVNAAADDDHSSEFVRLLEEYIPDWRDHQRRQPKFAVDSDPNPFLRVDMNQCILCTRCVRACADVQGRFVWGVAERGAETKIIAGLDTNLLDARCESCGACVAYCPTGALTDRMSYGLGPPDRVIRTTCGYCGVGCQFDLQVKRDRLLGVASHPSAPVNGMSLCVKGRYGYEFVHHPERLRRPRVRKYLLEGVPPSERPRDRGPWVDVSWSTALELVATRLSTICCQAGPAALGFLASAKCTNEENYLFQKLARQLFASNNVDHCARLCHSSTVAGLAMAVGSGAMTNSMDDIASSARAIFVIGSNTTEQHPVFGARLRQAARSGTKLVVADPRRIELTEFATLHLRQRPGTDVALINGLMHLALKHGWQDDRFVRERCEGFSAVAEAVASYSPAHVAEITGIAEADLIAAAELLCTTRPMAVIWAMGITQHTTGVLNVLALANLQMMLGNLGVAGGGLNPLRGQNNVQGACDMGALPNVLPGYQAVADQGVRESFQQAWALAADGQDEPQRSFDAKPGQTVTELIEAAGQQRVRGLYILGEDPAMTDPDTTRVTAALERAELVVLQEIFPSETSRWADVLLPGASFAEKQGTFTNTERRVQPVRPALEPPAEARPDWQILSELGQIVMNREGFRPIGRFAGWEYGSPEEVLNEIAALTPSYRGVNWSRLEAGERLQWPVTSLDHPGTPILHVAQFPIGKGRFHVVDHAPPQELPDRDYPLLLTTGRVLYHWHGGELTRRSAALAKAYPEPIVEVSPEDARQHGIGDGKQVRVTSRRGELIAQAAVTDRVPHGVLFGSFHFPGSGNVNNLTILALDPVAKIPEYKVCAVAIEAIQDGLYDHSSISTASATADSSTTETASGSSSQ